MPPQANIYDYPEYYDLVYGSDWKAEYDFLLACFDRYLAGKPKRIFEPACGTGRLLYRLGNAGYTVSGNDLNRKSIDFCNKRLADHGLPELAFVGDMSDFTIDEPVDVGFNMINSFRHLPTESQAVSHLKCMRNAIADGGLYILGLHLSPLVGETCDEESWTATDDGLSITSRLGLVKRNLAARYEEYAMSYEIESLDDSTKITDQLKFRTYTAEQFETLVDSSGFEIEAVHDFSCDIDFSFFLNERIEDAVFILRAV